MGQKGTDEERNWTSGLGVCGSLLALQGLAQQPWVRGPFASPTHFPGVTIVNQAAMAVSCPATAPPATKPPAQESRTSLYGAPTVYLACARCREEKAAEKQKL